MAYSNGFLIEGSVFMDNVFATVTLVLVFIGSKIFLVGIIGKIPAVISLTVTLSLIAGGVLFSLWKLGPRR